MSKSHTTAKHMSPEAEDRFQEGLEGEDFGSIDDWETELGLKILKIQKVLSQDYAKQNHAVHNLLTKKLIVCQAALDFLDQNPKAAATVGSNGGLQAVMAYIVKQATDDAAQKETRRYSDQVMPYLPGYRLGQSLQRRGGLIGVPARIADPHNEGAFIANPDPNARADIGLVYA